MPSRSTRLSTVPCVLKNPRVQRVRVAADGSCWLYAVLAGLGKLEHGVAGGIGKKTPLPRPTLKDREMDKEVRTQLSKTRFLSEKDDVLRVPDYNGDRRVDQFLGSFGGVHHFAALCHVFGLQSIVVWDEVDAEEVMVVTDTFVYFVTPAAAELMAENPSTVHIAYSREKEAHVEAYVRSRPSDRPPQRTSVLSGVLSAVPLCQWA